MLNLRERIGVDLSRDVRIEDGVEWVGKVLP